MNSDILCQRAFCTGIPTITCKKCNIVKYCSKHCMQRDLPGHSIICDASFCIMVTKYINLLKTRKAVLRPTVSYPLEYVLDERGYQIGLNKLYICLVCNSTTPPKVVHYKKLLDRVYYVKCDVCRVSKRTICTNTYKDASLCRSGLPTYMLLREFMCDMPTDIFNYIISMIIDTSCVKHLVNI